MRVLVLALVLLAACKPKPENVTPEGTVRALFGALEAMSTDPARSKDALAMLGPATAKNLEARAQRASKVEGRTISAADYLSTVRYLPRAHAVSYVTSLGASGDVADVAAADEQGHELAHVTLEKRGELWRVELPLPDLPALQRRAP